MPTPVTVLLGLNAMKNPTGSADGPGPAGMTFGSHRSLLIGHAVALIMVTICFVFGCSGFMTEWQFWTNGVALNATATRKEITTGPAGRPGTSPSKNYTVWYRYQDGQGQEHEGRGEVVESLWSQLQEGQAVEITYLPDQPSNSQLVGRPFIERWLWLILLATGGFIVVALVGVWTRVGWMWVTHRRSYQGRSLG
jgi:hypothetical protein